MASIASAPIAAVNQRTASDSPARRKERFPASRRKRPSGAHVPRGDRETPSRYLVDRADLQEQPFSGSLRPRGQPYCTERDGRWEVHLRSTPTASNGTTSTRDGAAAVLLDGALKLLGNPQQWDHPDITSEQLNGLKTP